MSALAAPVLCLVTDRRRLCPGGDVREAVAALVEQARFAADAAIDLIQVRERDLEASALAELVGAVLDAVRGAPTRVVINDRVDVAVATRSHGVHLRGDSVDGRRVRAMAPPSFLIGRSVHGVDEARTAAASADYLVAGTVFDTDSKPGRRDLLGSSGLHTIAHAVSVPVLAIGGVTLDRIPEVARAGASGVAAIGLFLAPEGPVQLADAVREIRHLFASASSRRT